MISCYYEVPREGFEPSQGVKPYTILSRARQPFRHPGLSSGIIPKFELKYARMIAATDLKNGVTFLRNDKPYKVIKYSLMKVGRGGATVRLDVRNLETGANEHISYSSNIKVDEVSTQKRRLQYLYNDGVTASFMDPQSFDQVEIPVSVIEAELPYIKEGDSADILFWEDKPLSIDIAPKVVLTVTKTDPGVKGNSVSNIYKPATLENGLQIKVPLFINEGEKIRVDTRSGSYIERAQE